MDDYWDRIRDLIATLVEKPGWSQSKLASRASIAQSTISTFLNEPSRGLQKRTWKKLATVLESEFPGAFPDPPSLHTRKIEADALRLNGGAQTPGIKMIPVVDIRRYPVNWKNRDELVERVGELAEDWIVVPASDPQAHAVIITTPVQGLLRKGARLIIGPKTPALEGDFVAVVHEGQLRIAEKTTYLGEEVLRFPPQGGTEKTEVLPEKDFEVIGKILADYNPW